ncbi:TfoX/Sxy family protein [Ramlibacter tataouinensis]|uniref:TfoX/Sxy family protein n=1 Tax=Ramlibacter tataouinensis TaxID=94132 RepID=UPI00221F23E9|nr:TfoX/Sxy family protein [Ramlibacter tataouinensis]
MRTCASSGRWLLTPGPSCTGRPVSLNLLWALEGAITGERWQEVARRHRTSLLLALEDHERRA